MSDKKFHKKVDKMFESKLKQNFIRVKDLGSDKILTESDMNYKKVFFDSNMNIYKIKDGELTLVENENFKAIIL